MLSVPTDILIGYLGHSYQTLNTASEANVLTMTKSTHTAETGNPLSSTQYPSR